MYQDIKRHEGIFPEMIREIGAKRVVVDSITHFQRLANNTGELREIIYSLINALKREGLTPLLLRELVEGEVVGTVSEEYTADAVVHLTMERINGQRMRYLEVLKSRGSRHVPAKSLFFIREQGLEVVPPFQDAFFRYQEAVSIGIPDVDSLMGGGIPYGAFYLFEVSPELHQEVFELNFIKETFHAHDRFFEIAASGTRRDKLLQLAQSYGMQSDLQAALDAGQVQFIHLLGEQEEEGYQLPVSDEERAEMGEGDEETFFQAIDQLDELFQQTSRSTRGRLFLDLTRLLASVDESIFFAVLEPILDMVRQYGGVCVGFLSPEAIPISAREKLLTEADGIVRMWKEQNYHFIQVVKTVNSVLTPVNSLIEINTPPYLRIMQ
jgi:circadian clock protein KaiC